MNVHNELVSIIIPVYNRVDVLSETLESLINQSYINWECILIDDGSTDGSDQIIKSYLKKDARFQFYSRPSNKPKGANACRNYGFTKANGAYVNWLDSDDLFHGDALSEKVELLAKDESLDFVACLNSTFHKDPNTIISIDQPRIMQSTNYIEDYLLNGLYFFTSSPLWRKTFLRDKELFDEALHRSQERDFHFRMLLHQPKYFYMDKVLIYKRLGDDTISAKASTSLQSQLSIYRYFDKVFQTLDNIKVKDKLKQYVLYRQLVNYYNINQLESGILSRMSRFKSIGSKLLKYCNDVKAFKNHKLRILFGIFLLVCFRKGYKFIYFPEYNFRLDDQL